ncbi:MAG TPA: hypothetical protein VMT76_07205, partial [Puia sp.]|nr:hypothetical protein [Puia sp.]
MIWLLVQLPSVQTWLVKQAAEKLSKSLHTTVSISHVDFSLFNKMLLRNILVEDKNKDTILSAGSLNVQITDWFFRKDKAQLEYIGLNDATIKLQRRDSVWNYQFLIDYFSGPQKTDTTKGIELDLKKAALSNIHFVKHDEWRGEDFDMHLGSMQLDAEEFNLAKKTAKINVIEFAKPEFAIINYDGRRPPLHDTNEVYKNDPLHLRLNGADWSITAKQVTVINGTFKDFKADGQQPLPYFDGRHILFYAINGDFKNVSLNKDTVTAQLDLSTKERSGFEVKKLTASVKFFPEAMEFHKLDLQTGKSHIRNFYAMRFRSFDDMSDYESRINMEGDFSDAYVDSDDIGFFAPELKNWNRKIRITGIIRGPVENLKGTKVILEAGKNTLLNGDIHLKGLPDIDKTFIEFRSNDFRTNYADASTLIPQLKQIKSPRLDRIEQFRFTGSFTGFLKDFVTNGVIETNLGTLVTDVNMKFPDKKPTIYSGNINTADFDIGRFLDINSLGKVAFTGKVKGTGLAANTLNAALDGAVESIEFSHYNYHSIIVNGAIAKKKFNGQLVCRDSNLDARMIGLIDYNGRDPKFDLSAEIGRTDLKKIHLTEDSVEFSGKVRFNFTGSNIDNFIGTARVYDAAIYKSGRRISFDSLAVESSVAENSKSITVVSNEFDAAIAGEFSIHDLPDAIQTFLNKYYPAYIKPVKGKLTSDQNFSFVLTTKKVDDYVSFIDKNLSGFNNTTISGRINTKNNLLDVNGNVPQFGYKNFSFLNTDIRGNGNYDSLSLETNIGEVYVNDSLHFPNTHVRLRSSNDLSDMKISTSANHTLNSANVDAQIKTSQTGFHVKFNPSTFDVNGKKWAIQKNGEFAIDNNIVTANSLKIYSDDQQVLITTHPSSSGKWNDIHLDLKKINIGDFTQYFVKSDRFEGVLTGSGEIRNPLTKELNFDFTGRAEQFRLDNDSVGYLDINAGYDKTTGLINAHVNSDNRNYHFDIKGIFNALDSNNGTQPIDITTNLVDTKIDLLEKYLNAVFSNVHGYATGQLHIIGSGDQLKYLGDVKLRDGKLKVNYTQCTYSIPSANILLRDGFIDFGSCQVKDTLGHTAQLTRGRLSHHSFNDLSYDFAINTNKLLLLNTKASDNNQFYGKVIGRANLTLKGPNENMLMEIRGEPTDSSDIFLPMNTTRESADADFLVWKVYGKEMQPQYDRKATNLTVKLDVTANNYANVYVIVDPLTGDIMKANGHGNI